MRCAKLHMTFIHASKHYQVCTSIVSDDEVMFTQQGPVECVLPLPVDDALNMNMLVNCYCYDVITVML